MQDKYPPQPPPSFLWNGTVEHGNSEYVGTSSWRQASPGFNSISSGRRPARLLPWHSRNASTAFTLVLYGRDMLDTVGSFAPGTHVLFFVAITAISYKIGFGMEQQQRSSMALGMSTRNIAAVFAAYLGITNPPSGRFARLVPTN